MNDLKEIWSERGFRKEFEFYSKLEKDELENKRAELNTQAKEVFLLCIKNNVDFKESENLENLSYMIDDIINKNKKEIK